MADTYSGLLPEHASANANTTNPVDYSPTAEEKEAIKLATRLFEKSKNYRKKYDLKWLDYYKMFRGKQWKEQRPSYRHSEVINMIFQTIQSMVPIITDARPRIEFVPEEPSDRELAEILNEVAESDWVTENWLMQLTETVYDAHFYGVGFSCVGYDPDAKLGIGAITYESSDPFYLFPDPAARDINKKAKYIVYAEPVDVDELKKDYPDKAKFIKADLIDLMKGSKTDIDQMLFRSPTDNTLINQGGSPYEADAKNQALKITLYIKSDEFIEEQKTQMNSDTGVEETIFEQKLKYPNGRKIVTACGVLLDDGPMPFDDGLFPYARLVNYILPREFYGISEIEQLESPQKIFNKLVSFALDVLTLMGNPVWVVDNTSGIDTDNLTNAPGMVVEKEPNSEVRREAGVELQPYVFGFIDRLRDWFEGISGMNDVTQGAKPENITAASAIQSLQEAAQTRLRLKTRNLDCYLQDVGKLYLSRVFQFYSAPRIARITNNQNAQKYFKFHIETTQNEDGTEQKVAHIQDYLVNPETGQTSLGDVRKLIVNGNFDVRVSTGSSLPFAKADKFNKAKELFQLGVIDDEELLKQSDYPNWESVLERMKQKQAQLAAQQAPPQGGGPPPQAA